MEYVVEAQNCTSTPTAHVVDTSPKAIGRPEKLCDQHNEPINHLFMV